MQRPKLSVILVCGVICLCLGCASSEPTPESTDLNYPIATVQNPSNPSTPKTDTVAAPDSRLNPPKTTNSGNLLEVIHTAPSSHSGTPKVIVIDKPATETIKVANPPATSTYPVEKVNVAPQESHKVPAVKEAPVVAKTAKETTAEDAAEKSKEKSFHLRVISLPYHELYHKSAQKIANFIKKEKGLQAHAHASANKTEKFWVVDVGKFDTPNTAEAKAFQKSIQEMKYENTYQFKDAYYISY